jgi:hypothetical protein
MSSDDDSDDQQSSEIGGETVESSVPDTISTNAQTISIAYPWPPNEGANRREDISSLRQRIWSGRARERNDRAQMRA